MPERQPVELRFLSQEDGLEAGLVDMDRCVETMAQVFELYDQGRVLMGPNEQHIHGYVLPLPGELAHAEGMESGPDRRFSAMPAYVGGDIDKAGIKWYGSNVQNPEKRGLPRSIHLITLNDATSGKPEVVMDGQVVSAMRTGAMAGLGAATLQGDRATTATVLGPGVVGQTSALGLDAALDQLETLNVYHPELAKARAFEDEMAGDVSATVTPTDELAGAVRDADVTVAATTADPPVSIAPSWLGADSLVIPLGDVSVPLEAFDSDRIVCDIRRNTLEFAEQIDWEVTNRLAAAVDGESGPSIERSDLRALHEIVAGTDSDPTEGRSVFYSPGLPMEDVAWASEVYQSAKAQDVGQTVTMVTEPYFTKPY